MASICLATGARWSEAEGLKRSNIQPYRITFTGTKNSKNRTVPISEELYNLIDLEGRKGELFSSCYGAFRKALSRTEIELPKGQAAHVLRHTFASHFIMNGGNILVLQKILGHSTLTMTIRYAHLAPDHLEEAATLNPLDARSTLR